MAPLELTCFILNKQRGFERGIDKHDWLHEAFVSPRLFRILTRGYEGDHGHYVSLANADSKQIVIASLREIALNKETAHSDNRSGTFVSPSVAHSLGVPGGKDNISVELLRHPIPECTEVFLSEIRGATAHSDAVHRLCIDAFLRIPRLLSVGETIGVPTWISKEISAYNDMAEKDAPITSWIGPGRAIDATHDFIQYKVVSLRNSEGTDMQYACANDKARVLIVGSKKTDSRGLIPGIRSFLYPLIDFPEHEGIVNWLSSGAEDGPAVLIGKRCLERLHIVRNSIERRGMIPEIISCPQLTSLDEVAELFDLSSPCSCFILDDFDVFEEFPLVIPKTRFIVLVEDYSKIPSELSARFPFIFEWEISDPHASLIVSYKTVLPEGSEEILKKRLTRSVESEEISSPNVEWSDIGGLDSAKQELRDLMSSGLRRGVLLYGPPGTGKTLLAKAIATEASCNGKMSFIGVKGPELLSMYIGESERNIRSVFSKAKENAPCVIFFDELDSLAPSRGRASDSANVMDRVVASLLTELDNLPPDVIIVGATNRPDLLDPALVRPGRIDRQVYVGVCEDKSLLVQALSHQFKLVDATVADKISPHIPRSMTGSDVAGLLRKAHLERAKEIASQITSLAKVSEIHISEFQRLICLGSSEPESHKTVCDSCVMTKIKGELEKCCSCGTFRVKDSSFSVASFDISLDENHIFKALSSVAPSITEAELERYEQLRDQHATVIG